MNGKFGGRSRLGIIPPRAIPCLSAAVPPPIEPAGNARRRSFMSFPHRHLLGIKGLTEPDILYLLDAADEAVKISRRRDKKTSTLRGLTQINLFFEASTRTQASFELAGKRLGADVMNMSVGNSSVKKGETLIDTAMTLNAMRPDILVRAPRLGRSHGTARPEGCLLRRECRRRRSRASDPGAARRANDPPRQGPAGPPDRRHLRRRAAQSRVARSNIVLLNAHGCAGAGRRHRRRSCPSGIAKWASRSSTRWRKA
jgi:aspartate carbamoyltransferase catalytic subunit